MQHPADDAAFDALVASAGDMPVLMKFSAEWCGPCQMIKGDMEALAAEYDGKMVCIHVDVDNLDGTSQKYGVECMPTIMVIKGGQPHGEKVQGANMNAIKALAASAF